ncbi:MAG: cbb3-type cytochrome c oxidase subunit 3 [Burkholderiales bacterium]|nr:cbb3-type cytochrome c oxidase subunit 3 [Burkholderiales bacterium]
MDVNDLRALWTLLSFLVFAGIAVWAYSSWPKQRFEAAARLPLDDDQPLAHAQPARAHTMTEK